MQITSDVSKISKTFQRDLTFISDVLSESLFGFVSYSVFQAVENVVSFTTTSAAQQCVTMPKRYTMIMATIWYKGF